MKIYFTTCGHQQESRILPDLDLGASFGVQLCWWNDATNNIQPGQDKQWAAYARTAAAGGASLIMVDREVCSDADADRLAIAQAVHAAVPSLPIMFYGTGGWLGSGALTSWAYINPSPTERTGIYQLAKQATPWAQEAGTVCIYAQVARPTEARTIERLLRAQHDAALVAAPNARQILFIQDTWNWSGFGNPQLGEGMARRMLTCGRDLDMDVCVFQPFLIDKNYPYRPFWDVLGEFIVCPLDRQQGGRP